LGVRTILLTCALALASCQGEARQPEKPANSAMVGLASSLPLVMPESADIAELLADRSPPHWALAVLREQGELTPLDSLSGEGGALPLPAGSLLVMAQPWPLSPQENVALDNWVRAGGRVLLFADPMLTYESRFAVGDRRRPQDVAMLSPILTRWGLRLERDDEVSADPYVAQIEGVSLPVRLPGRFSAVEGSNCLVEVQGLLAECPVGKGRVVAIADAAMFDSREDDAQATRATALKSLLARLFN